MSIYAGMDADSKAHVDRYVEGLVHCDPEDRVAYEHSITAVLSNPGAYDERQVAVACAIAERLASFVAAVEEPGAGHA